MLSNIISWHTVMQCGRKKCRLNEADIVLAKKLRLNPKSLIKNIPNKSEQWKAPVSVWIHEIEEKRTKKSEQKQRRKTNSSFPT
jgi:hypothetical protein